MQTGHAEMQQQRLPIPIVYFTVFADMYLSFFSKMCVDLNNKFTTSKQKKIKYHFDFTTSPDDSLKLHKPFLDGFFNVV